MAKKTFQKNKPLQLKIYGGLCIVLILFLGYHAYSNVTKMIDMRARANSYESLHSSLLTVENRVKEEHTTARDKNRELAQRINNELQLVFPTGENHTILTRSIDQMANNLHRSLNPFMISNLQYMSPRQAEDNGYMVLPFRMTIHSSYDNFFAFLRYVQNSGSLSQRTRLLDMPSIVINFVATGGAQRNISGQNEINFNVSANAYFRPTET